jgi:hypothetical protein
MTGYVNTFQGTATLTDSDASQLATEVKQQLTQATSSEPAGQYAAQAVSQLSVFLAQLGALAASMNTVQINPLFPQPDAAPAISVPLAPSVLPAPWVPPQPPVPFTGTLDVAGLFPTFSTPAPNLIFPLPPSTFNGVEPPAPPVDLNFVYPTLDLVLPTPPDLLSVQTVQFGGVNLPTIDPTLPVLTVVTPTITTYIQGAPYTDALLSVTQSTLQDRVTNGSNTGLPSAIETNLWNRAREREMGQMNDAILALDRMEAMGYAFPPGVFVDAQIRIQTEFGYLSAGLERDIATKQAELIQTNILKALDSAVALEAKMLDYQSQYEQRNLEAAKYATQAAVEIYNAQVGAYRALVEAYQARVQIYAEQIKAALATVEVYRIEVEAQKLIADIDTALVQQYASMVQATLASVEVYKAQISAIQIQAEIQKITVEVFAEQIKAYVAQVNAYTAQVEGYKATVETQGVIEGVFKTQVDAFAAQVAAVSQEVNAQVEIYKAQIAEKSLEYDGYKALIAGQAEEVKAIAMSNESVAKIYTAVVGGTSAFNETLTKQWQVALDEALQVTQIGVKAAEANGQLYVSSRNVAVEAARAGAQVEAQVVASDLGRLTYSTHLAAQATLSDSVAASGSTSYSTNMAEAS